MDLKYSIKEQLKDKELWRVLAFALSSTQRINKIINEYATTETKTMFEKQIEILWKIFWGENVDISMFIEELETRPEYNEDDSLSQSYYAMRALGMIFYSINVAEGNNIIENAIYISTSMLNLCSDIDSFALDFGHKGDKTLEQLETEIQMEIIKIVNLDDKKEIIEKIQEQNFLFIEYLQDLLPYVKKGNGWS